MPTLIALGPSGPLQPESIPAAQAKEKINIHSLSSCACADSEAELEQTVGEFNSEQREINLKLKVMC